MAMQVDLARISNPQLCRMEIGAIQIELHGLRQRRLNGGLNDDQEFHRDTLLEQLCRSELRILQLMARP